MRKYDKDRCTASIHALQQSHQEIAKYIEKKKIEDALIILQQCQEEAIRVGTWIESQEGEGTEAVRMLEEYCELVYQTYDNLIQENTVHFHQVEKKLRKVLQKADADLQNGIRTQLEVVFLPYKAAMWDSLESVWQAAQEDPDCTTHVIPIPYYDRDEYGRVKELHYEADLYPENIPLTDYRDYDFEERHPDMIFIHNPYDGINSVTSTLSFFYSENLKKYTDCLVYIPYFVLDESMLSHGVVDEHTQHLCCVPAVRYADYVIVQSECVKNIYVDVLTQYYGKHTEDYWRKKVLGLGSPKVDRIMNFQRENFDLPESWKKIIFHRDGSRKKVIFYNISLGAFLEHDEKMVEKIREVLQFFKENQDQFALIWRPHPLMKASVAAVRPQLWEDYDAVVKDYQDAGWGIYDDTPDMTPAVAISDAYYGDAGSGVWLYEKTGKPIMIQNCDVK